MPNNEITVPNNKFIVSKTDLNGKITYGNALFLSISGYTEDELIGSPHNILRHSDMPKLIFKLLWEHIQNKKEIFAYVKNKTKQGDYYWVYAHVTASLDSNGKIIGYHSVRRKPKPDALQKIITLYSSLNTAEKSGGMAASEKFLNTQLTQSGKTYDEFIFTL